MPSGVGIPKAPVANFLMLNPSTADEVKLDPSCTRARRYAERWGFGALVVTNYYVVLNAWALSLTPNWLLQRL